MRPLCISERLSAHSGVAAVPVATVSLFRCADRENFPVFLEKYPLTQR
jgi:hypothetical protein